MSHQTRQVPLPAALTGSGLLLIVAAAVGIAVGPVPVGLPTVLHVLAAHLHGHSSGAVADTIVWQIRVPRVLLAALVGATLAIVGAVVQTLVRNPLADPFLLGISSGASVGATAVLLFGALASLGVWALSTGSILGALAATTLVFLIARTGGRLPPIQLILCGVVLSALFSAVASLLLFLGNPQATQSVLFYLLGSFGNATWSQLPIPAVVLTVGMAYLLANSRALNALAVGAGVAASIGIDVRAVRRNLLITAAIMAGVAVAVSGVIGFVGLVVPHIVRLLVRSDHRRVLPVAMVFGSAFTVLGDLLARTVVAPQEMPMGVITAFIGAPVLLVLIRRRPDLYGASGG